MWLETSHPTQSQILVRKGGIREPTFTPKAQRFLLFPTAFHTDAQLLKPGVAEQFHQVRPWQEATAWNGGRGRSIARWQRLLGVAVSLCT